MIIRVLLISARLILIASNVESTVIVLSADDVVAAGSITCIYVKEHSWHVLMIYTMATDS